jgi:tetratricopeptide (TPR) repeat protein
MDWCVARFRRAIVCPAWVGLTLLLVAGCAGLRRMGPVREDVMRARQLSQQGIDAWQHGQPQRAESIFQQAVDWCPDDVDARCRLAECLWERGARQPAIEHLTRAVEISDWKDASMLIQLGRMQLASGNLSEAAGLAELALRSAPQNGGAWRLQASVLERQGRLPEALDSYYRSLSYDAHNSETLLAVAEIHHQLGRPNRTLATLQRLDGASVEGPQGRRVWELRGLAQQQVGRSDEALESLTKAVEIGPPSADLLGQLAQVHWQLGQEELARRALRDALLLASPEQRASLRSLMAQIASFPGDRSPPTRR